MLRENTFQEESLCAPQHSGTLCRPPSCLNSSGAPGSGASYRLWASLKTSTLPTCTCASCRLSLWSPGLPAKYKVVLQGLWQPSSRPLGCSQWCASSTLLKMLCKLQCPEPAHKDILFSETADLPTRRKMVCLLGVFFSLLTYKIWLLPAQSFEVCVCYLFGNAKGLPYCMFPNSLFWTYPEIIK